MKPTTKKQITIKQIVTEKENGLINVETTFESKGLNDFEIVGLLTYYQNQQQVNMMKEYSKQPQN